MHPSPKRKKKQQRPTEWLKHENAKYHLTCVCIVQAFTIVLSTENRSGQTSRNII